MKWKHNKTEEEEWEVEAIKNHRMTRGGQNYQFLVAWKGWPESENSWEPAEEYRRTPIAMAFHRKHPSAPRHMDDLRMKLRFQEIDHPDPQSFLING